MHLYPPMIDEIWGANYLPRRLEGEDHDLVVLTCKYLFIYGLFLNFGLCPISRRRKERFGQNSELRLECDRILSALLWILLCMAFTCFINIHANDVMMTEESHFLSEQAVFFVFSVGFLGRSFSQRHGC